MKIAIVAKYWFPFRGGIEDNAASAMTRIADHHAVAAIAFNHEAGSRSERLNGIDVQRCDTLAVVKSQPISLRYVMHILRTDAELIYFHAPNVLGSLAILLKLACSRRPIRLVTMHHMDIFGRPLLRGIARQLYDRVLRRSDRLIVTSLKNATISQDIRVTVPTIAIPLGVTPARFAMSQADRSTTEAWRRDLCGDAPAVVFVGRLARYKGLDVLARAMESVPAAILLIAGTGPYREPTERLVAALGLSHRVRFLGEVSHAQKLRLMSMATVFAFPSTEITEAFGVSQLEAMLLGAPAVAADLPTGVTDVAIDGETALTVPPGDAVALAAAIRRLIADPDLRARLAARARERVLSEYTTDLMARRNADLIEEVLAEELASRAGARRPSAQRAPIPTFSGEDASC